jgi:hypothetical protein
MNAKLIFGFVVALAAVVAGVLMGGTAKHPAALFLVWLFPVMAYESYLRAGAAKRKLFLFLFVVVLLPSAYGLASTVGWGRIFTQPAGALLVYLGMIGVVWLSCYIRCKKTMAAEKPAG